jgi:hypothetical protein
MIQPMWMLLIVLLLSVTALFILLQILEKGREAAGDQVQIVEGAVLFLPFPSLFLQRLWARRKGQMLSSPMGIVITVLLVIAIISIIVTLLAAFSKPGSGTQVGIIEQISGIFS